MGEHICGIQQVGIGTDDLHRDWKWYRSVFSMDIKIFEDAAEAPLMTRYTGGEVHKRVAALALNMQGGGGIEIWQYASRKPQPADFQLSLTDAGILSVKMKTRDAKKTRAEFAKKGVTLISKVTKNPAGDLHFFVADTNGYWFDIVESKNWFKNEHRPTGGVYGAVIGVSDMEKSLAFYRDLLGFDEVLSDTSGAHADFANLPGGNEPFRRVILAQKNQTAGPFSPLLGQNQMELIQPLNTTGRKIFADRYWGDLGFIHMCFDVKDMSGLKTKATKFNYPFTVDSADSFDMGKAAGRFGYVEDPDGALIEFVETHKIPIVEKWGWFLDLRKRNQEKSLPRWLLNCFRFNRIKA
jgi:catechol 2,3-dioxygenase-like lactoylglutathione lyase family enzyme